MKPKKFFLKSEKNDSITQTPKTPLKNSIFRNSGKMKVKSLNFEISDKNNKSSKENTTINNTVNNTYKWNNFNNYNSENEAIFDNDNESKNENIFNDDNKFDLNNYNQTNFINNNVRASIENVKFKSLRIFYDNEIKFEEIDEFHFENDFVKLGKIGEGDFYSVYAVKEICKRNDNLCLKTNFSGGLVDTETVITCIKKSKSYFSIKRDYLKLKEIQIMSLLKNKRNIVRLINAWQENNHLYIQTELCNGTLKDLINQVYWLKKERFDNTLITKIIYDIGIGLEEMHDTGIIHMDIKPDNIFIRNIDRNIAEYYNMAHAVPSDTLNNNLMNNQIHLAHILPDHNTNFIIGDFNISKFINEEMEEDGDKKYMAPESLKNLCTIKSDVFSLGLIFLELLTGIVLPSSGNAWIKLRKNGVLDLVDNFGVKNLCCGFEKVLEGMLEKNEKKRMNIKEVLESLRRL